MRFELPGHDVFTVAYMGWAGVENGELLRRAATAGFAVLVTTDRGLEYQQNKAVLPIAVVVILVSANTMETLRPAFPALLATLASLQPCEFIKLPIP
jgi:hypothetical protein